MKTILLRSKEFSDWILSGPADDEVKKVFWTLNEKVILGGLCEKRDYLKLLLNLDETRSRQLIAEFLEELSILRISPAVSPLEELKIQKMNYGAFSDLVLSEELVNSHKRHTRSMRVNNSRDHGFDQLFGHLLESLTEFELVDGFIGKKAEANEEVLKWLLTKVSLANIHTVSFVTKLPFDPKFSSNKNLNSQISYLNSIAKNVSALQKSYFPDTNIRFNFFSNIPHNRFIRLKFPGGQLFCAIHGGIDAFKNKTFQELQPVQLVLNDEFMEIQKSSKWKKVINVDPIFGAEVKSFLQGSKVIFKFPGFYSTEN